MHFNACLFVFRLCTSSYLEFWIVNDNWFTMNHHAAGGSKQLKRYKRQSLKVDAWTAKEFKKATFCWVIFFKTRLFRLHSEVCLWNKGWDKWNLTSRIYLVWWPEILSDKSNNDPFPHMKPLFCLQFSSDLCDFSHLELLWSIFWDIPEACTWSTLQEEGQVLSVGTVESGHVLVTQSQMFEFDLRSYASGSTKWRQKLQHFTPSDGWL